MAEGTSAGSEARGRLMTLFDRRRLRSGQIVAAAIGVALLVIAAGVSRIALGSPGVDVSVSLAAHVIDRVGYVLLAAGAAALALRWALDGPED